MIKSCADPHSFFGAVKKFTICIYIKYCIIILDVVYCGKLSGGAVF